MQVTIKAWLSIGSTYTYLTALRLRSVVEASGIKLDIRPISIRQIMKNMDNIPFPPSKKTKLDYMWRDIQRRSEFYSLPVPDVPAPYPLKEFDRANLVGILMEGIQNTLKRHIVHGFLMVLKQVRIKIQKHGLRSTFRDWVAETGQSREAAELQLAHKFGSKVEHSYYRTDLLDHRAKLLTAWFTFLEAESRA